MSIYGTIVEVLWDGEAKDVAMLVCRSETPTAFEAVVVKSSTYSEPHQRLIAVRGMLGVINSMWSVREEKP